MENIYNNISAGIGNTPLIKLQGPSKKQVVIFMAKQSFLILEDQSKIALH